jgi:hypothetical protein
MRVITDTGIGMLGGVVIGLGDVKIAIGHEVL